MCENLIPTLKQQLAAEILLVANDLNFWLAADLLGIDTSRLSDLRRGRVARFSLERLIRMLMLAERRVELNVIRPPPHRDAMRIFGERQRRRLQERRERQNASEAGPVKPRESP